MTKQDGGQGHEKRGGKFDKGAKNPPRPNPGIVNTLPKTPQPPQKPPADKK